MADSDSTISSNNKTSSLELSFDSDPRGLGIKKKSYAFMEPVKLNKNASGTIPLMAVLTGKTKESLHSKQLVCKVGDAQVEVGKTVIKSGYTTKSLSKDSVSQESSISSSNSSSLFSSATNSELLMGSKQSRSSSLTKLSPIKPPGLKVFSPSSSSQTSSASSISYGNSRSGSDFDNSSFTNSSILKPPSDIQRSSSQQSKSSTKISPVRKVLQKSTSKQSLPDNERRSGSSKRNHDDSSVLLVTFLFLYLISTHQFFI